ncbi:PAS domain S-box protein [Mesorhizobium sp. CAU 1741]|uniref:PAS domain S-box protein n=1 Tax=Mesorhizobium sp. CAU 1741 TaxID=3140366 RepID=UPI00325ACE63
MAPGPYSFIDIAVLEDVRARFAAGDALAILTIDLDEVIWANGAGAMLFGHSDIEAVMGASPGLGFTARRQIAATPGFPRRVSNRTILVRLARGMSSQAVPFAVSSITMPDGEPAILLAAGAQSPGSSDGNAVAARIIEGFREAGYFAALLDAQAQVGAASAGFADLGIEDETLRRLVDEVGRSNDRLVKRLAIATAGLIPVGIARLTDDPQLHLLIAIDEAVEQPAPAQQAAPPQPPDDVAVASQDDAAAPSDADLPDRMQEDEAAFEDIDPPSEGDVRPAAPSPAGKEPEDIGSPSDSDDWYFEADGASEQPQPQAASARPARKALGPRPDLSGAAPVRFVWRTDAAGAFSTVSDEFFAATGHDAASVIGRPFREVADEFGLDPTAEIAGLLERRDTWSGRSVLWPIAATDLRVPVDLAALPAYSRDRTFEGFRGFGVVRLAEAVVDAEATHVDEPGDTAEDRDAPAAPDKAAEADDPFRGEVPVISIAESRERRVSDKIIKLAEHRPAPTGRQLSPGERNAFEEIRARLRQDYASRQAEEPAARTVSPTGPSEAPVEPAVEAAPDVREPTATEQNEPEAVGSAPTQDVEPSAVTPDQEPAVEAQGDEPPADLADQAEDVPAAPEAEDPAAPEAEAEPARETMPAPPIASSGFIPSAFSTSAGPVGLDQDFLSTLPLPVLVHAGDELYFANPEFLALTGYASLEALRREGGLGRLFVDNQTEAEADDEDRKLRLRTLGGEEFSVDAHLQSIRWEGSSALMLALRRVAPDTPALPDPVPAPVIADPAMADMEDRVAEMRTIIDTATDGVVLITRQGTIRNISRPAEALFGFDSAEVEGEPFTTLFAIESQRAARDYLNGLADNGVASVLNDGREVIGREAEGRFIPLFMSIGRLPGDSGYCAVVRDITQWKRAEEELTQARSQAERASSQKTEFLARVSHEIRTPLNAIIGFSELMLDEKFGPIGSDRYRDYLRDINRSGNHVLDLVNDLLDISKIEAGEQEMNYEAVSLNDALAESVAMMQPQANRNRVIIRSSLASRLPEVVADLRSVRQIALNLLSNAIRYTQAGGQVIVSTSYEPSGDVVMRVRDTGIGMSLAEIDQAMKPFKQINALKRGRHDGTGLGLPLTKAMVEANRARFTIVSTPGEGTLVEIIFPSTRVLAD